MKNIITRNFISSLIYFCFGALIIVSCSQESTETFDSDEKISLRKSDEVNAANISLKEIPEEFYDNASKYVENELSSSITKSDAESEIWLDCVWIDDEGFAHIKDGCTVDNSIPDFGCKIVARGIGDCYVLANNPDCIVCIIWVVLECEDGKLYWYNKWFLIC